MKSRKQLSMYICLLILALIVSGFLFSHNIIQNRKLGESGKNLASQVVTLDQAGADELKKNREEILAIVHKENPKVALAELAHRMDTTPIVFRYCHSIAHDIGHKGYDKYKNFTEALKYEDSVCSDGYLHGVIEEHFGELSDTTKILAEMKNICIGIREIARCYHGVGHAVMYYTKNDLPKAIEICSSYSAKTRSRGNCYEGMFMENFLSDEVDHPSKYVDKNNPFFPCPTEPSGLKSFCYFYAPIYYLGQNNDDYAKALAWCGTAEKAGVFACVRGVGSLMMKYHINDPKFSEKICDGAPAGQISACIDGMVSYYLTFYDHVSIAKKMCSEMEKGNQGACNRGVARKAFLFID